jgi:hypothetical protein
MNVTEIIRQIIREELAVLGQQELVEGEISEKSVPEPYNRAGRTKLSKGQIEKREKIGNAMRRDQKTVAKFRKKYGQDWESYLWASASAAVKRGKK